MTPARRTPAHRSPAELLRKVSAWQQLVVAGLTGAAAAALSWTHAASVAALLVGWDVAAAIYLALLWTAVRGIDAMVTARLVRREDPTSSVAELVLLGASVAALVAIGLLLFRAGHATGSTRFLMTGLGVISVVLSWLTVHTVFMLRYARAYYQEPIGGIDFNQAEAPTYRDIAYFSFTIGMTFQVSDTSITSSAMRRMALHHALLSYLFGAVILAVAINVVAGLLH